MEQKAASITLELGRIEISGRELRLQLGRAQRNVNMLDSLARDEGFSLEFDTTPEGKPIIDISSGDALIAHGRPVLVSTNDGELSTVGVLIIDVLENGETLFASFIGNVLCLEERLTDSNPGIPGMSVQCRIYADGVLYGTGMVNNAAKIFNGSSVFDRARMIVSCIVRI